MANPLAITIQLGLAFSASWTTITDVVDINPIRWRRGLGGNGPLDLVATPGTLTFTLRNDAGCSGHLQGYYSPRNVNVRAGFVRGIPCRLLATVSAVNYPLWTGKLSLIDPEHGRYGSQRVHCVAVDCMQDLADADVRSIVPQINQTEVQLLQALIAALPSTARPVATSYDAALDSYPYAFDTYSGGVKAMTGITDTMKSARGFCYPKGDGTLRYENRRARAGKASSFTFTDLKLHGQGIVVSNDLSNVYNRIRARIHGKTVDAAATTVLYAAPTVIAIAPSLTVTVWGSYADPTNTIKLIGGTDFVTPISSPTDFLGNTQINGSGANVSSSLAITTNAFAASVQFLITNNGTETAYLVDATGAALLHLRGRGIADNAPLTLEKYVPMSYGDRPLDLDLPFQADATVGQGLAEYVAAVYAPESDHADAIEFYPLVSTSLLTQAVTGDIGDIITATETVTGFNAKLAIQAIEGEIQPGPWMILRYVTAPQLATSALILDDLVFGVLDAPEAVLYYA